MAKDVRHPAPQDTETSLLQLKHWAEQEATQKTEQLHDLGEEISNRARETYPDSLDDAIEEIPYAELDPELIAKAHEFNTLRFAMAHLRAVAFAWDSNAKLIYATAEIVDLAFSDHGLPPALVVFRPEATHAFSFRPKRIKDNVDLQLLTDLLTNIEINSSPTGLRIYSALQKPENLHSVSESTAPSLRNKFLDCTVNTSMILRTSTSIRPQPIPLRIPIPGWRRLEATSSLKTKTSRSPLCSPRSSINRRLHSTHLSLTAKPVVKPPTRVTSVHWTPADTVKNRVTGKANV